MCRGEKRLKNLRGLPVFRGQGAEEESGKVTGKKCPAL